MLLKSLLIPLLLISSLSADIEVISVKGLGASTLKISNTKKQYIRDEIKTLFNTNIKTTGKATLELYIDPLAGKVQKAIIYSRYGSRKFKEEFKLFLEDVSDLRMKPIKVKSKLIKFKLKLKKEVAITDESELIFQNEDRYTSYLKFLKKEYGYSNTKIKQILDSKKKTVVKTILMALYYDSKADDYNKSKEYYELLVSKKLSRFERSNEGLYIADYLLKEKKYTELLKVFPKMSCELYKDSDEKNKCFYYQAKALYSISDPDYLIPLNISKNHLKVAKTFYNDIKNNGAKKDD